MHGLLIVVTSVVERRLQGAWASAVVVHGLSCPRHVGSSQARDWTSLLHWQANSLPLSHWEAPTSKTLIFLHQGGHLIIRSNQCQDPCMWHLDTWSPVCASGTVSHHKAVRLGGSGGWLPGLVLPPAYWFDFGCFTIMVIEVFDSFEYSLTVSLRSNQLKKKRSNQLICCCWTSLVFILNPNYGEKWALFFHKFWPACMLRYILPYSPVSTQKF